MPAPKPKDKKDSSRRSFEASFVNLLKTAFRRRKSSNSGGSKPSLAGTGVSQKATVPPTSEDTRRSVHFADGVTEILPRHSSEWESEDTGATSQAEVGHGAIETRDPESDPPEAETDEELTTLLTSARNVKYFEEVAASSGRCPSRAVLENAAMEFERRWHNQIDREIFGSEWFNDVTSEEQIHTLMFKSTIISAANKAYCQELCEALSKSHGELGDPPRTDRQDFIRTWANRNVFFAKDRGSIAVLRRVSDKLTEALAVRAAQTRDTTAMKLCLEAVHFWLRTETFPAANRSRSRPRGSRRC